MKTIKIIVFTLTCLINLNLFAQQELKENEFIVEISGNGTPVILFPGFTCTSEVYDPLISELSNSFEVHAFTFAGFGTIPPIEGPWLNQIKNSVYEYIKKNSMEDAIAIGHSMGGTLALWLASEDTTIFSRLIVVDALPAMGALMIPDYKSENIVYDNPYNERLISMGDKEFGIMAKQMASSMCQNPDKQQQIQDWIEVSDRKTYVYGYTDLLKLDLRDTLKKIEIPVTIFGATQPYGKDMAEKNYRDQYANLAKYDLIFAENSGHFIMYDQPDWFMNQVKTILNVK